MIKETNLEDIKSKTLCLDDRFYLNTQKPENLYTKIKNKLKKHGKPFGLGIAGYLIFELVKKIGNKTSEAMSSLYSYTINTFNTSIDSFNIFLLNFCEMINPRYYFYSVTQILSLISYITAVGFLINSLRQFKDHNDTQGEVPVSQAVLLLVVAGLLFTMPTLLNMAKGTII